MGDLSNTHSDNAMDFHSYERPEKDEDDCHGIVGDPNDSYFQIDEIKVYQVL